MLAFMDKEKRKSFYDSICSKRDRWKNGRDFGNSYSHKNIGRNNKGHEALFSP